ncbi:hypothetical protein OKA05_09950 [Luteolibacter arcticus]|uniref:PA14 domain-containing protein n=1 Tax=Luteolibacter arcticus TaxID=1581411 RepID=A0ABT3GHF7_9BACT|nr:hypothetical protein [Luteolibacter arcticus]MCW1922873.1 hypothetical protein [Luteolibacter arcticus]
MITDESSIEFQSGKKPRRIGWGAFSISVLVHAIFILLAIFYFFTWIETPKEKVPDFVPGGGGGGNKGTTASKIQTRARAMAPATARKIVSQSTTATFSLPDSSEQVMDSGLPSTMMASSGEGGGAGGGKGGGIGTGVGTGTGPGSGPGVGRGFIDTSPFGSKQEVAGALPGRFYDFKQTRQGKTVEDYDTANREHFTERVNDIQKSDFRPSAFKKFFEAPDPLYLSQIASSLTDAGSAPKYFNVADKVKPSGWLIHYHGNVVSDRDITVRFLGVGDDYISVFVKGKPRMINGWPDIRETVMGRWKPDEPVESSGGTPLTGCPLVTGDWVKFRKGEKVELDIAIGERPGGKVGFVLMVEEKGVEYRTMSNGAKVLPLFTTEPISEQARTRITKEFPHWEFEWEKVPVFPSSKDEKMGTDIFR